MIANQSDLVDYVSDIVAASQLPRADEVLAGLDRIVYALDHDEDTTIWITRTARRVQEAVRRTGPSTLSDSQAMEWSWVVARKSQELRRYFTQEQEETSAYYRC